MVILVSWELASMPTSSSPLPLSELASPLTTSCTATCDGSGSSTGFFDSTGCFFLRDLFLTLRPAVALVPLSPLPVVVFDMAADCADAVLLAEAAADGLAATLLSAATDAEDRLDVDWDKLVPVRAAVLDLAGAAAASDSLISSISESKSFTYN